MLCSDKERDCALPPSRPRRGWMVPTHRGRVTFPQSTHSNADLSRKRPHGHTRNNVLPTFWSPLSPVKLTQKINYHKFTPGQPGTRCIP